MVDEADSTKAERWYNLHCQREHALCAIQNAERDRDDINRKLAPLEKQLHALVGRNAERKLFKIDAGTFVIVEFHDHDSGPYRSIQVVPLSV